jgi:hypothetical protein
MHTSRHQLLAIFLLKIAYAFFAVLVFSKFTSLGDTQDYLHGEHLNRNNIASTAYLMSFIGVTLGTWGGFILCLGLSVLGILYLLEKTRFSARNNALVMILIALPSFGVWTSIFSKEVFVLFSFCLCTGGLIDLLTRRRRFFSLLQIAGFVNFYEAALFSQYLSLCGRNFCVSRRISKRAHAGADRSHERDMRWFVHTLCG